MGEKEYYEELGKRIRIIRKRMGLTQEILSERLQISRPSIANIEAGRQRIRLFFLYQLAKELNVPLTKLIV